MNETKFKEEKTPWNNSEMQTCDICFSLFGIFQSIALYVNYFVIRQFATHKVLPFRLIKWKSERLYFTLFFSSLFI